MSVQPYKTTATVAREEAEYWAARGFKSAHDYAKWWKKNTEKGRILLRRANHRCLDRRKRELGFHPLNKPFEGSVAHHIDNNNVVYMPGEIHREISHCVKTGYNMEEINAVALLYW